MKFTDSSGRSFTDYTSNCSMYDTLQKQYAPDSSQNDFRIYLQQNADVIMRDMANKNSNSDFTFQKSNVKCPVCNETVTKE